MASKRFRQDGIVPRAGLTLIEVLMSIFVLAIGLFGVAALLPLGQKKMIEGAIDQRKAQVAASAFEYLGSRGGLNPTRWAIPTGATTYNMHDVVTVTPTAGRILCRVTGSPTTGSFSTDALLSTTDGAYVDCIVEFRGGRLRGQRRLVTSYTGSTRTFTFSGAAGTPSEPLAVAPYVGDTFTDANSNGRYDPGETYTDANANGVYDPPDTFVVIRARPFVIDPLLVAKLNASPAFAVNLPSVTLLTTAVPSGGPPAVWRVMDFNAAESLTTSDDDLVFLPPSGQDPPQQLYASEPYIDVNGNGKYDAGVDTFTPALHDMNGNGVWDGGLKRKSDLNLSWLATVVPTISGNTEQFRVSVVVFYKRVLAAVGTAGGPTAMEVRFTGTGLGGGSAKLRANSTNTQADLAPVRANHWIIVSNSTGREYRWYRISAIGPVHNDSGRWARDVTLVGADWNTATDQTAASVYCPGVVGVFERSMPVDTLPDAS